jgi:hypothetical protein
VIDVLTDVDHEYGRNQVKDVCVAVFVFGQVTGDHSAHYEGNAAQSLHSADRRHLGFLVGDVVIDQRLEEGHDLGPESWNLTISLSPTQYTLTCQCSRYEQNCQR